MQLIRNLPVSILLLALARGAPAHAQDAPAEPAESAPASAEDMQARIVELQQRILELEEQSLRELQRIRALLHQQNRLTTRLLEERAAPATQATARPAPTQPAQPRTARVAIGDSPALGTAAAPVTVIEFTDYQCGYCSRFHANTFPTLKQEFIDTGRVRFVARHLPLRIHARAEPAARAAHCAGEQGRFWEMHHALFSDQQRLSDADLRERAGRLGLDLAAFERCMASPDAHTKVADDVAAARAIGITGTPTFIIARSALGQQIVTGRVLPGAASFERFASTITALLPPESDWQKPPPTP